MSLDPVFTKDLKHVAMFVGKVSGVVCTCVLTELYLMLQQAELVRAHGVERGVVALQRGGVEMARGGVLQACNARASVVALAQPRLKLPQRAAQLQPRRVRRRRCRVQLLLQVCQVPHLTVLHSRSPTGGWVAGRRQSDTHSCCCGR